ncbi:triose-phosphate isomerase [Candidatus Riesia pediculischaeffi]|uniref:Triosephosphate isomerase n=1 Tax=Candidatus Riesia pediculischaeffi PTSU TaxID=1401651 RepID=A0A0C1V894_9ENTR|nr:triose-phosphate isomerase [Candidatus Riesia pediculischaeffi]KIE64078.1 Triosephosphate isomerase [Candidatus Riesia pediculischaeffi PTSU]
MTNGKMKKKIIIGNWKLNGSLNMIENFFKNLRIEMFQSSALDFVIAPPFPYLMNVGRMIRRYHNVFLGAQNVDLHLIGAYTGEISSLILKDVGVKYTIVGHSERRMYHLEKDAEIAKKFLLLQKEGIIPILCVGESLSEKRSGNTESILMKQIRPIIEMIRNTDFLKIMIAYEPVWSIGTGNSEDPSSVQKTAEFIKGYILDNLDIRREFLFIHYGGSVNSKNFQEFIEKPDIDGLLIGKCSIEYRSISEIFSKIK